ncbi:phage tail tape measure protein [Streptomyces mirabilis]|uniref:phage tail tape measure protein n=1 Tax=Streptomyces mirabilis TaxID=68239 RepID=UPI0036D7831D
MATAKGVKTELGAVERSGGKSMAKLGAVSKAALLGVGVAAGVAAVKTVHMAADFQTQMTRVRTGAGEAAKNMGLVGSGVLQMAGRVGESTKDLTAGLYLVESAGYHGGDALKVLETSAMGAKVGAADLATVTDAVTTAMNAYGLKAKDTTGVMNALVGTEAEGKTNLEALAGSMSGILPVAAAAHVKLNDVLGAMATMTSQGTDARVSATYLRQTIGQLSNPSAKAAATMKGLGLNATEVSKELGKRGLAATLTTLTDAIKNKMGPGGTVLIDTLQKAASKGKDFQSSLNKMTPTQKTYIGALSQMVGGTKSMMGALMLSGPHMDTYKKNVAGITKHVKDGGKEVEGWADVQKTFNQRMAEFKGSAEALGISIGQKLLPAATKFAGWLSTGLSFLQSHSVYLKTFAVLLGGVTLGLAAASIASWSFTDSLLANPITWIVAGIVALVAGLAYLLTHWKQVWSWIKTNIPAVANAFKATWKVTLNAFHAAWAWAVKAVQGLVKWFNANVLTWVKARMKDFTSWWKSHSKEIHQTWDLLWKQVKRAASVAWAFLKVGLGMLKTEFKVGWAIISGVVKTAWALISGAVTFGMHWVMNIIAVLTDVITGHWGKAWQDVKKLVSQAFTDIVSTIKNTVSNFGTMLWDAGKALVQGLIDGVKSMWGAAKKAVSEVMGGLKDVAKSVLHINSPSKVFRDEVGKSIPEGLALGVTQNAHMAHGAVRETANGMVTHFKDALGINSPSKVFRSLGIWIHTGLVDGLTGSSAKVKSAIKHTETLLMQTYNKVADLKGHKGVSNHWVSSHESAIKHLETYVRKEGAQLDKLAKQRDGVAKRLKDAQNKLKALQKSWTDERNSIASGIMQNASVVMSANADGGALTASDVLANMQNQAQAAMQFSDELTALKKKGLRADLIEQIANAGVDGGGATAQALLNANKDQINQLNNAQKQMGNSANKTGGVVADAMYKAGIHSAQGLVKGLQSQEKTIEKQMEKIAKAMAKAIKKELGIKSPSRVFHEIGQWVTAGLVNGVDSGERDVRDAAVRMSQALTTGGDAPTLSGSAIGSTAAAVVHQVHIEVHGSVRSDRDLRDVIQTEMQRYGGRNSVTWQQFKR